jgi:hypothetical protein
MDILAAERHNLSHELLFDSMGKIVYSPLDDNGTENAGVGIPVPSQGFVHHTWPIDRLGSDEDEENSQYKQDDLLHTV